MRHKHLVFNKKAFNFFRELINARRVAPAQRKTGYSSMTAYEYTHLMENKGLIIRNKYQNVELTLKGEKVFSLLEKINRNIER